MNKQEFLQRLHDALADLPQEERQERLTFYSEMIDDRMEEGLTEAEAICQIGAVDEILSQSVPEHSTSESVKPTQKPQRKWRAWEIVLLVLGSPIWISLGIAAVAVILSLYASVWALVVSLWSVFVALLGSALGGVAGGIVGCATGNAFSGVALIGMAFACVGLSIFAFFGCKAVTKATVALTQKTVLFFKKRICCNKEAAV